MKNVGFSVGWLGLACGLLLGGCQGADEMTFTGAHDYHSDFLKCMPKNSGDNNSTEHDCASNAFEARKNEMDMVFKEVAALYQKRADSNQSATEEKQLHKFLTSQSKFNKFIKNNAKLTNMIFISSYPYNYYGSMTDYINVRLRHLRQLKNELSNEE